MPVANVDDVVDVVEVVDVDTLVGCIMIGLGAACKGVRAVAGWRIGAALLDGLGKMRKSGSTQSVR